MTKIKRYSQYFGAMINEDYHRNNMLYDELVYAVQSRHYEKVEDLLRDGVDPNLKGENGILQGVCKVGDIKMFNLLLPHSKTDSDCLYHAAQNGHLEIVKKLVESGQPIDDFSFDAAVDGQFDVLEYFLQQGASSKSIDEVLMYIMDHFEDSIPQLKRFLKYPQIEIYPKHLYYAENFEHHEAKEFLEKLKGLPFKIRLLELEKMEKGVEDDTVSNIKSFGFFEKNMI